MCQWLKLSKEVWLTCSYEFMLLDGMYPDAPDLGVVCHGEFSPLFQGLYALIVYTILRHPCLPCTGPQKASYTFSGAPLEGSTQPYHSQPVSPKSKGSRASLLNEVCVKLTYNSQFLTHLTKKSLLLCRKSFWNGWLDGFELVNIFSTHKPTVQKLKQIKPTWHRFCINCQFWFRCELQSTGKQ